MPKKKEKRTFFKIKEKLVFIPSKKFFGRRVIGIICLIGGSLVLAVTLIYFYIIPGFFSAKNQNLSENPVPLSEERLEIIPKRIIVPFLGLDFLVNDNQVDITPPLKNFNIEKGEEILIFDNRFYWNFFVTLVTVREGTSSSFLELNGDDLKLTLQNKIKPPKILIIEAKKRNEK